MTIAAVVLAAGASRRLGRPKQNIVIAGETLLRRTVRIASEAGLTPVIVVTRAEPDYGDSGDTPGITTVVNENADEGIASSIRAGIAIAALHNVSGVVILTCDQPALRIEHLRMLIADPSMMRGSAYGGSIGVPAYFPEEHFPALSQLIGDTGARALLKAARSIEAEDLKLDIDTEDDVRIARAIFEKRNE